MSSDPGYRGEACQHLDLDLVDLEVILARAPRALEGEVKGGSSLEGAGKGRL
jgi:hypothetical protein